MFDILPKFLSSIASFLFPLFASYKALKTSDPAQLTPWLMYWSVFACALLVESWLEFILVWVPFYAYLRLLFLLYLVLPQTQGARQIYETYLHPYLSENEAAIEDFIASAHDRLKAAGIAYLKRAIEVLRTKVMGLPPNDEAREADTPATAAPQGYTQALLARFSVPAARWAANSAGSAGNDFYNILAGAVSAATTSGGGTASSSSAARNNNNNNADTASSTATLIPENIGGAQDKISFIAAQRERLAFMMGALDKEAQQLERTEEERRAAEQARKDLRPVSMSLDGQDGSGSGSSRPPSGHSILSKSRSEVDFEKIDAESGTEEDDNNLRRRAPAEESASAGRSGWSFLGWGSVSTGEPARGQSSGVDK
ncbi:TB2/DP1, HVA22 family-domain-containing protein [Whalleya microplaca]|nr:TB2/DP1, HVA22 family-domain-containing protein [Whalleya microplaca]